MTWFVGIVIALIALVLLILFLNRYYRKATREVSVIRTGLGGQKIVLDGGCIALPFLHKVSEVNMRTTRLEIERNGAKSIITRDRLRVDLHVEAHARHSPGTRRTSESALPTDPLGMVASGCRRGTPAAAGPSSFGVTPCTSSRASSRSSLG